MIQRYRDDNTKFMYAIKITNLIEPMNQLNEFTEFTYVVYKFINSKLLN